MYISRSIDHLKNPLGLFIYCVAERGWNLPNFSETTLFGGESSLLQNGQIISCLGQTQNGQQDAGCLANRLQLQTNKDMSCEK